MTKETDKLLSFIYDFLKNLPYGTIKAYRVGYMAGATVKIFSKQINIGEIRKLLLLKEEREDDADDVVKAFINGFMAGVSVGWE